jgi:hypothetical protein
MDNLSALFTMESLLSLQGSAAAALLVPAVLLYLVGEGFRPAAKWVSFIIALGLSYLVAYLAADTGFLKWVLAFFNGFLVFASAVGINQGAAQQSLRSAPPTTPAGSPRTGRTAPAPAPAPQSKGLFTSWF